MKMDTIETLAEIKRLLAEFYTPEEAKLWWLSPHPRFDGMTAASVVDDGRATDLLQTLRQLDQGGYL